MKVWVNSTKSAGVTDGFICLNYAEEPTIENEPLGIVTKHVNKPPKWFCQGKSGTTNTVEEAQKIVVDMVG